MKASKFSEAQIAFVLKQAEDGTAAVDLRHLDPLVQGLCGAADGALSHFRGKFVRGLTHDAPSYSRVGASGKPVAVQSVKSVGFTIAHFCPVIYDRFDTAA